MCPVRNLMTRHHHDCQRPFDDLEGGHHGKTRIPCKAWVLHEPSRPRLTHRRIASWRCRHAARGLASSRKDARAIHLTLHAYAPRNECLTTIAPAEIDLSQSLRIDRDGLGQCLTARSGLDRI